MTATSSDQTDSPTIPRGKSSFRVFETTQKGGIDIDFAKDFSVYGQKT